MHAQRGIGRVAVLRCTAGLVSTSGQLQLGIRSRRHRCVCDRSNCCSAIFHCPAPHRTSRCLVSRALTHRDGSGPSRNAVHPIAAIHALLRDRCCHWRCRGGNGHCTRHHLQRTHAPRPGRPPRRSRRREHVALSMAVAPPRYSHGGCLLIFAWFTCTGMLRGAHGNHAGDHVVEQGVNAAPETS